MSSIDDHEILDAANTHLKRTVQQALADADALCTEVPNGAETLARYLLQRIRTARDALEHSLPNASDAARQRWLSRFEDALVAFAATLRRYNATKPFVEQVLSHLHVVSAFKNIQRDLVELLANVRGDRIGLETWKADLEQAVTAFDAAVEEKLKDATTLKMYEEDSRLALEAATVLKLAQASGDRLLWNDNPQAQRLWAAMEPWHKVEVPYWFTPERDIKKGRHIKTGAYGAVYRGDWKSGTNVIIKYLLDGDTKGHEVLRAQLIREADLWSRLTHPHILQLSGACHVAESPFFVSDDAKSGDLADYLVRNKSHRMQQLHQMALAIEYLHDKGILHGDLKLDNAFVFAEGHVRLADFSVSRFVEAVNGLTKRLDDQDQAGALRWRAPEALEGKLRFESDIFSFAMCIIQAMTGEVPYGDASDDDVIQSIRNMELPVLPDDTPAELCALVKKMTKREPEDRIKIKDVIPVLKKLANEEIKKNQKASKNRQCEVCHVTVADGSPLCHECKRSKEEAAPASARSSNVSKLLRTATLSDGHDGQNAPKLLSDYLRLHPEDWFHVVQAGAIPILGKIVRDKEDDGFAAEALKTLALLIMASVMAPRGVAATMANGKMKSTMEEEKVLLLFKTQLQSGSDKLKGVAVKTLGFWPDRKAITEDTTVMNQIRQLASSTSSARELGRYANLALNALAADPARAAS